MNNFIRREILLNLNNSGFDLRLCYCTLMRLNNSDFDLRLCYYTLVRVRRFVYIEHKWLESRF